MATAVVPTEGKGNSPIPIEDDDLFGIETLRRSMRTLLTKPVDEENELVRIAAIRGPEGICSILRARGDYYWIVSLGFRAIQVCLGPRPSPMPYVNHCDSVEFATSMMELEMIDEIIYWMKRYKNVKVIQARGLAILELLIMDDVKWRDEVARRGAVRLVCDIANTWSDDKTIMQVLMGLTAYLAAEDYIEILLGQHGILHHIQHCLVQWHTDKDMTMRCTLSLFNMTFCNSHVEEFVDHDGVDLFMSVMEFHRGDPHLAIAFCGVIANLSSHDYADELLVERGIFDIMKEYFRLEMDPPSTVLIVATIKALLNFAQSPDYMVLLDEKGITSDVSRAVANNGGDANIQKYGNMFMGHWSRCSIM